MTLCYNCMFFWTDRVHATVQNQILCWFNLHSLIIEISLCTEDAESPSNKHWISAFLLQHDHSRWPRQQALHNVLEFPPLSPDAEKHLLCTREPVTDVFYWFGSGWCDVGDSGGATANCIVLPFRCRMIATSVGNSIASSWRIKMNNMNHVFLIGMAIWHKDST
jgi:hypothetical protein